MNSPFVQPISHRSVLAIAVPIMLSNVSEPLIGVVNTAVVGRLPDAYYIGAIAVGSLIFSFVFWGFGFLRLATSGLSAQAVGAGDTPELVAVLLRSLMIAAVAGLALIALSPFIRPIAFSLIGGSPDVQRAGEAYFDARIWSAPFAFANFTVMGWFIGQAKARLTFLVQLVLNLTNMALSAMFVLYFHLDAEGVGLAALISELVAATLGLALAGIQVRRMAEHLAPDRIFDWIRLRAMLAMNADVMVRTLCLIGAFAFFTARGARAGDVVVAANAVLMNLFSVSAYLIDGFANASEALVGQSVGARDRHRFRDAVRVTSLWALVTGTICTLIIAVAGPWSIDALAVNPAVRAAARHYLYWAAATPLLGAVCFQFDGIFTGAMATRDMRNMMVVSLLIFLAAWALLEPAFGNHGLWAALCIFFVARGVTFASRLPAIERRLFA